MKSKMLTGLGGGHLQPWTLAEWSRRPKLRSGGKVLLTRAAVLWNLLRKLHFLLINPGGSYKACWNWREGNSPSAETTQLPIKELLRAPEQGLGSFRAGFACCPSWSWGRIFLVHSLHPPTRCLTLHQEKTLNTLTFIYKLYPCSCYLPEGTHVGTFPLFPPHLL